MNTSMKVSDHALIRFLERSGRLDIEAVRRDIADSLESGFAAAAKMGANEFAIRRERWKYIFKEGTLVTCYPEEKRRSRHPSRRRLG